MQLLRWSSDEARKLYAQIGAGAQASLLESAVETPIDCIRSHTLVTAGAAGPSAGAETHAAVQEAGEAVEHGAALVEAAHDVRGALPAVEKLPGGRRAAAHRGGQGRRRPGPGPGLRLWLGLGLARASPRAQGAQPAGAGRRKGAPPRGHVPGGWGAPDDEAIRLRSRMVDPTARLRASGRGERRSTTRPRAGGLGRARQRGYTLRLRSRMIDPSPDRPATYQRKGRTTPHHAATCRGVGARRPDDGAICLRSKGRCSTTWLRADVVRQKGRGAGQEASAPQRGGAPRIAHVPTHPPSRGLGCRTPRRARYRVRKGYCLSNRLAEYAYTGTPKGRVQCTRQSGVLELLVSPYGITCRIHLQE